MVYRRTPSQRRQCTVAWLLGFMLLAASSGRTSGQETPAMLTWDALPDLPNRLGVAGPFVGVHADVLLVAGGANFPEPVWENEKQWVSDIYILRKVGAGYVWQAAGTLERPTAYGANVSVAEGVVCIGGNDAQSHFSDCFLLSWNETTDLVETQPLPSLPEPLAYAQACVVGDSIYVAGGQTTASLESARGSLWSLKLAALGDATVAWEQHPAWPGPPRAFNVVACQNNGFDDCLYLIGGRYQDGSEVRFLSDCWEYNPRQRRWRQRAAMPQAMAAGTGVALGQSHILMLSGDSGELFSRTDELRDEHPGFPRKTFAYHTITDTWTDTGTSPANQVTTTAVKFEDSFVLPTGEIRPRVRTPHIWRVRAAP